MDNLTKTIVFTRNLALPDQFYEHFTIVNCDSKL